MPREEVLAEVRAWFAKAESDGKVIQLALPAADCPFDAVCFHAEQAAEKYLKGYLTFLRIPFPKVHDLEELCALIPAEAALRLEVGELAELSEYAIGPRYPGWGEDVDRATAERARSISEKVKSAVLASLARMGFTP